VRCSARSSHRRQRRAAFTVEEQLIQRHWVIDNRFYSFEDWINDRTRWDIAQHKIPLVTWEPHEPLDEIHRRQARRRLSPARARRQGARRRDFLTLGP